MVFIIVTPFNFIFVKNVLEKAKSISNLGNFERLNPREISWNCRFAKLVSGENPKVLKESTYVLYKSSKFQTTKNEKKFCCKQFVWKLFTTEFLF